MWDDSYDSMSSPEPPKGRGGGGISKSTSFKSSLHDTKSGLTSNSNKFQKSDQRDIDLLFSPGESVASEANSPDEREKRDYVNPYSFEEPKQDNYLANFATNSGDLEDSILGELLGGGPKKSIPKPSDVGPKPSDTGPNRIERGGRKLSPAGKLEPLESKSPKYSSSPNIPPKGTKDIPKPISRFSNEGPLSSIRSVDFSEPQREPASLGGGRAHFNSFDVGESVDEEETHDFPQPSKPSSYLPTKVDSSLTNKRTTHVNQDFRPGGIASTASTDALSKNVSSSMQMEKGENTSTKTDGGNGGGGGEEEVTGFIPSFLDPNRQGRRRRGVSEDGPRPATTGGMRSSLNKLDELDAALGLATGPATGPAKKPVDPFASTVEKKISTLPTAVTKKGTILGDSDSSDDDDLLKPKSRYTPKFGAKDSTSTSAKFGETKKDSSPSIAVPPVTTAGGSNEPTPVPAPVAAASSTSAKSTLSNLPSVSQKSNESSSVVKLPSPEHKSTAFTISKSNNHPNNNDKSDEERDDLDISGILKANDEELALFGLRDNNNNNSNNQKDNKRKVTANSPLVDLGGSRDDDNNKDKDKPQQQEKQQSGGIQLSRKSVGNIRPIQSPTSAKKPDPIVTEIKSPVASSSMNSRFAFEEEKPAAASSLTAAGRYPRDNALSSSTEFGKKDQPEVSHTKPPSPKTKFTSFETSNDRGSSNNNNSNNNSSNTTSKDTDSARVQQILDQTKLEKEKMEKEMINEIERLKNKLYSMEMTATTSGGGGGGGNNSSNYTRFTSELETENRVLSEQSQRLLSEQINYKRIISQLEFEINSLKDENNSIKLKAIQDTKQLNEKFSIEKSELLMNKQSEIDAIEKRHRESLQSLKEIHANEVQSYKDRLKNVENLENLITLIQSTSYSMKGLEETLTNKHQSIQLIEKGYLESREKLLIDLESKTKDRISSVEVEEYKLKGLLVHMESMISSLRSNYLEEKTRLMHENTRLSLLQENLIKERQLLEEWKIKEMNSMEMKKKELDQAKLEFHKEKMIFQEHSAMERHIQESNLQEREKNISIQLKTIENKEFLLLEDKNKFLLLKDSFFNEKRSFEEYKHSCEQELLILEDSKKLLRTAIEKLNAEKEEVFHLHQSLQQEKQSMELKVQELSQWEKNLSSKENILNNSLQEMSIAAGELANQERVLMNHLKEIEVKKKDLIVYDQSLLDKKLFYFQQFRENMLNNPPSVSVSALLQQQQRGGGGGNPNGSFSQSSSLIPMPTSANAAAAGGGGSLESQPADPINLSFQQFQQQMSQLNHSNLNNNPLGSRSQGNLIYSIKSNDIDDGYPQHHHPQHQHQQQQQKENTLNQQQQQSQGSQGEENWSEKFKQQLQQAYAGKSHPERLLPKEIQSAQKLLRDNRNFLQRHSSIETRKFIDNESKFINNLELLNRQKKL